MVKKTRKNKAVTSAKNGRLGGRPQKYDEPTTLVAGKLPNSLVAKLAAYGESRGLNRTECLIAAVEALPAAASR